MKQIKPGFLAGAICALKSQKKAPGQSSDDLDLDLDLDFETTCDGTN